MDRTEMEALFARTVSGDYESDDAWAAVGTLRSNGDRAIFEYASEWCHSANPVERARGAAILCQLRRASEPTVKPEAVEWLFRDESWPLLLGMSENESDLVALQSVISALGHMGNPAAILRIVSFQSHPNEDVRFAVAFALGCFPNDPDSIRGLLKLTSDSDTDVRDWAVFGLGVLGDADSPEIRTVLLRCLDDPDEDVREEAAVGLGKRRDVRLVPKLLEMIDVSGLSPRVAEAAAALLELEALPDDWTAADCRVALQRKLY
jgi:hypothetical protein